jgi:GT2 family glycosyltransferase
MKASVIIPVWNGRRYLPACLDALLAQTHPDLEVIAVDNASGDGSADLLARDYPQVRLVRNARNLGFAGGVNAGLEIAQGDVVALLNQDTEVRPDWLAQLAGAMLDEPAIGIAGCKILYPDGTIQHGGAVIANARGESKHLGWHEADRGQCDTAFDAELVTGAALAISRAALECIGPLDTGFATAYYEDSDWCFRARAAGYRVRYIPQAVLVHHESPDIARQPDLVRYVFQRNRVRFVFKHWPESRIGGEFLAEETAWLQTLGPHGEALILAMRHAYLDNLLDMNELVDWRERLHLPGSADDLAQVLLQLRAACDISRFWQAPDGLGERQAAPGSQTAAGRPAAASEAPDAGLPFPRRALALLLARSEAFTPTTRARVRPLWERVNALTESTRVLARALAHARQHGDQERAELVEEISALAERLRALEKSMDERER